MVPMTLDEVVVQLKTLKDFCETSAEECPTEENVWMKDSVALQTAIDIIKRKLEVCIPFEEMTPKQRQHFNIPKI